jgi:HEAT repeat protein
MKTHLIHVDTGGMDPLATLGPASRSGRIYLRLERPLPEGDGIALKFQGPAAPPFLLDGIIVTCAAVQENLCHLKIDVTMSLAALLMEHAPAAGAVKKARATKKTGADRNRDHTAGPDKVAGNVLKKRRADAKNQRSGTGKANNSAAIDDMEVIAEIEEIEEIHDIEMIEIEPDPAAEQGHEPPVFFKSPPDDVSDTDIPVVPEGSLGIEEMRQIVSQAEIPVACEIPEEKLIGIPETISEKKTLTDDERKKAEPVGKFLMNLTKAMSRSGYYDPGHPGAAAAKKGLFEEFVQNAGEQNEIVFTREKTRKSLDIFITGVLDEQVSVRMLVGQGVAELFLPKLSDYYDRKGLLSFVIRKEITARHFDRFIDIMSDPKVDQHDADKAGALLTRALVDNGITEISTIFATDRIELGLDLPWRVEMAIQRLAKDFKIMPMFKGVSSDVLKRLKMQTIADILRPLKHPRYYSEFLVNCHVIAREVADVPADEIENMIVDAFPLDLLIPTSRFTFAELNRLEKRRSEQSEDAAASDGISARLVSIRRILKMVSRRVAVDQPPGATRFLADLYKNAVLAFEDLSPEAQYLVNSRRLADDIESDVDKYARSLNRPENPGDAVVCLKCFRRAAPILIEDHRFDTLIMIAGLINKTAGSPELQYDRIVHELEDGHESLEMAGDAVMVDDASKISEPFFAFVFGDSADLLSAAFSRTDAAGYKKIGQFLASIGILGVSVMSRVLAESKKKEIRKTAVESMIRVGELSRRWALRVLANKNHPWYLHRNALMIMKFVSRQSEDFETIRIFCIHENPKVREEVIGLVVGLRPSDAETLIIDFLDDPEARVRWRALRVLSDLSPISGHAMNKIIGVMTAPIPRKKHAAAEHKKKIANLISAVNGMPEIPNTLRMEAEILTLIEGLADQDKGSVLSFFKKGSLAEEDAGVIRAALPLLARIGTAAGESFLPRLRRMLPQMDSEIASVLSKIRERQEH